MASSASEPSRIKDWCLYVILGSWSAIFLNVYSIFMAFTSSVTFIWFGSERIRLIFSSSSLDILFTQFVIMLLLYFMG
jgi:Na+/alanine symporter